MVLIKRSEKIRELIIKYKLTKKNIRKGHVYQTNKDIEFLLRKKCSHMSSLEDIKKFTKKIGLLKEQYPVCLDCFCGIYNKFYIFCEDIIYKLLKSERKDTISKEEWGSNPWLNQK